MAKKSKDQAQSPKKLIQDKIAKHLLQEFQQLETLVGKKEFAKRLKKSAKIITQGLDFEEATKEDLAATNQPEVEAPKKTAVKKTSAPKKAAAKKSAKKVTAPKAAAKKAKPDTTA